MSQSIHTICMDQLAREAGVGKGTLYRRFVDRSSLCLALLDDNERSLQQQVLAGFGLPESTPASERLMHLLTALLCFALDNADLLSEAAASRGPAQSQDSNEPAVYLWRRIWIEEGIRAASVVHAPDPPLVTRLILQMMAPEFLRELLVQKGIERERVVQCLLGSWSQMLGLGLGLDKNRVPDKS